MSVEVGMNSLVSVGLHMPVLILGHAQASQPGCDNLLCAFLRGSCLFIAANAPPQSVRL